MQAVIMAGGEGKRLRPLTSNTPKPLLDIDGKPLIDHIIEHARNSGVDSIIVCAGYLGDKIKQHIEEKDYGISVKVSEEKKPLGTAGPLHLIKDELEEEFIVLYGDVYAAVNLKNLMSFHKNKKSDATLTLHESDHPEDSTVVILDETGRIIHLAEKPGNKWEMYGNLTSAALYAVKKDVLGFVERDRNVDFAKDVFPKMLKEGKKLYGYITSEYIKDMGTPERLRQVNAHIEKRTAVFLDRDGVINEEVDFLTKKEHLNLIEGAAEGIKMLNEHGLLTIVVTNQPVVARNMLTEEGLGKIHDKLLEMLAEKGARLDAIYYCPHHPEKNHPEANNPKYRIECECRKPGTGMIDQAAKTFKIDLVSSFVVGDRTSDVQLGKNAGCRTILVRTGMAGRDRKHTAKPDYECRDILEACELIVGLNKSRDKQ